MNTYNKWKYISAQFNILDTDKQINIDTVTAQRFNPLSSLCDNMPHYTSQVWNLAYSNKSQTLIDVNNIKSNLVVNNIFLFKMHVTTCPISVNYFSITLG